MQNRKIRTLFKENKSKEKPNWVLRDALVTAWTQVEALGSEVTKINEHQTAAQQAVRKARSETELTQKKLERSEAEVGRLCGGLITTKY